MTNPTIEFTCFQCGAHCVYSPNNQEFVQGCKHYQCGSNVDTNGRKDWMGTQYAEIDIKKENCSSCKFYKGWPIHPTSEDKRGRGFCRRNAPVRQNMETTWPMVYERDWCGEWKDV